MDLQARVIESVGMRDWCAVGRPIIPSGLAIPEAGYRQDGVFSRSQARAEGWTDDRQRRLVTSGLWVAIAGSVMVSREVAVGPWQQARAVSLIGRRVVSHATAGQLWGLSVPTGPHGIRRSGRPSPLIHDHRADLEVGDVQLLGGMPVTALTRTLIDLMCWLAPEESVEFVTQAFRRDLLAPEDLRVAARAAGGRTGAARARFIALTCQGRPFSQLEWRFHRIAQTVGRGWRFNVPIRDRAGLIGVVDALHEPTGTVVELDGLQFHGPDRFQADRSRDQRLAAKGLLVLRFTWQDVDGRSEHVAEILRRTLSLRLDRSA